MLRQKISLICQDLLPVGELNSSFRNVSCQRPLQAAQFTTGSTLQSVLQKHHGSSCGEQEYMQYSLIRISVYNSNTE